jgi:hypothetical protein
LRHTPFQKPHPLIDIPRLSSFEWMRCSSRIDANCIRFFMIHQPILLPRFLRTPGAAVKIRIGAVTTMNLNLIGRLSP